MGLGMMAKRQNKSYGNPSSKGDVANPSGLQKRSLKTPQRIMGGISSGHLDPTTLPKPSLPPWDGWKNIDRAAK